MVQGRAAERDRVDRMLADARGGASSVLLIHGEAGIGKTALLDYATARASGMRVLRLVGLESETELAFAGLHQLFLPVMDRVDQLPSPQARALRAVFGLTDDTVHDRFVIGLAVLTMLSEAADGGTLLCLVDDAQWLDRASVDALTFAARRLQVEGVVLIFAARSTAGVAGVDGFPSLHLAGLDQEAAAALVSDLPPYVRERILDEAQGNPLALRELSAALTPTQRAGQLSPLTMSAPSSRVQDAFQAQISRLPETTRALLLTAAADDTGTLDVILRAAEATVADLEPAERADLIVLSGDVLRFRHPLIRYAVYQGSPFAGRVAAHRALAAVLVAPEHAHRRAWQLAAAATGPDEEVADELERVAVWAGGRQALASASAAYERAAQLTAEPETRARRFVAAAQAAADAGQDERGGRLAAMVEVTPQDPGLAADLARVRAVVELGYGSPDVAARILLDCADHIGVRRPDKLPALLVDALHAAFSSGNAELIAAVAARAPTELVLAVPARLLADDVPGALRALHPLMAARGRTDSGFMDRLMTGIYCHLSADDQAAYEIAAEAVDHCRDSGMGGWLPTALHLLARVELTLGRYDAASVHATDGLRLAEGYNLAHRAAHLRAVLATLAAVRGEEEQARRLAWDALAYTEPRGIGRGTADALWALGLLDLGVGRADAALERFEAARAAPGHRLFGVFLLPDLVEAAVRAGRPERAVEPTRLLDEWARKTGRPGLVALAHRCRALTASDGEAEQHFVSAARLHQGGGAVDRARTALLHGEWLRRARRKLEARRHLRDALDTFTTLGAEPWARRAGAELRASGDAAEPSLGGPLSRLSPQEREVVRLAAAGATNREIAAQLFLSPRTVGHHLYRAFPKLGVTSRTDLATLLAS
ncbi:LuxR C-terminal-related transcriptional regulator [Micromonospora sp. RHAY321]|uniref:ATP-binding protein n=1 Tax=Micromonospora sp. RHAY321 TaxID=2944807 RepID=UPI00207C6BB2|nr:LuxR family transcriptional regulator [Micromonospora sp. RHAY321]MCO1597258.1 LuxR C-terminal-related transcriptional regulator [Micromonospora sp. RHAY321]